MKDSTELPERVTARITSVSEKIMDLSTRTVAEMVEADLTELARAAFNEGVIAERMRTGK